ncbi:hypothetical protein FOA52_005030 [Chlamydomonas sp. UWO 241]|nr:hypothetical protein FOA52_005030 [Chlamydomonas sp. UWO 241]
MVAIRTFYGQISLTEKRMALLVMLPVYEGEGTFLASEIKDDAAPVAPTVEEEDEEEEAALLRTQTRAPQPEVQQLEAAAQHAELGRGARAVPTGICRTRVDMHVAHQQGSGG